MTTWPAAPSEDRQYDGILSRFTIHTPDPIILISGATGVGTSTLGKTLLPITRAHGLIGTDVLRETLKMLAREKRYSDEERDILARSTYDAWERHDTGHSPDTVPAAAVIRAFHEQVQLVQPALIGAATRALKEGFGLIIEGVHILPRIIHDPTLWPLETKEWQALHDRLLTITLDCSDPDTHRDRLLHRDPKYRHRTDYGRYERYFRCIRFIRDEIIAQSTTSIVGVDNVHGTDEEIDVIGREFYAWKLSPDPRRRTRFQTRKPKVEK